MPAYRYIILDAYPLGNCAISISRRQRTPTPSEQCRQWLTDCERAGAFMLVPAIAYYEELREFERRQALRKIERFQAYCFKPGRLIPLSTAHLESAARQWGQLRRAGVPTADEKALDGDVILAAQVLSLNLPAGQFIVATRNTAHLTRFGLPADEWQNITP